MITNEFFQGYHQALNTVEENISNLRKYYQGDWDMTTDEMNGILATLEAVQSHIQQLRSSYREIQRQLANEQKKERT